MAGRGCGAGGQASQCAAGANRLGARSKPWARLSRSDEDRGTAGRSLSFLEQRPGDMRDRSRTTRPANAVAVSGAGRVLMLHDTAILRFNGERDGLGRIHDAGGELADSSFTQASQSPPRVRRSVFFGPRRGRGPGRRVATEHQRTVRANPQRESLRWARAVRACEELRGTPTGAIHVMDREGDNYDLFSGLQAARACYVIRLANNRKLVGEREKLKQVVGRAECLFRREVWVNPRAAGRSHDPHAARYARESTLAAVQYGKFMKLAGPYWMSCVTKNDAIPILAPDHYLTYPRPRD